MDSYNEHFRERTKGFALAVIRLADELPNKPSSWVLSKQVIRSTFSIAANYRAMCLAGSTAERFAKLCIVVEEADESLFWLELLSEAALISNEQSSVLLPEASIIAKTFTAYRAKLKPPNNDPRPTTNAPRPMTND